MKHALAGELAVRWAGGGLVTLHVACAVLMITTIACRERVNPITADSLRMRVGDPRRETVDQDRLAVWSLDQEAGIYGLGGDLAIKAMAADEYGRVLGVACGDSCRAFEYGEGGVRPLGVLRENTGQVVAAVAADSLLIWAQDTPDHGELLSFTIRPEGQPGQPPSALSAATLYSAPRGTWIRSLCIERRSGVVYFVTWPHNELASFALHSGEYRVRAVLGRSVAVGQKPFVGGGLASVGEAVYGAGHLGFMFRWRMDPEGFTFVGQPIPCLRGQAEYTSLTHLCADPEGDLWGATSAGYILRYSPGDGRMRNLGKLSADHAVRGLLVSRTGLLWAVTGEGVGAARLFSYSPKEGSYREMGIVASENPPWTVYEVSSMVESGDGTLCIGEDDPSGHLWTYKAGDISPW